MSSNWVGNMKRASERLDGALADLKMGWCESSERDVMLALVDMESTLLTAIHEVQKVRESVAEQGRLARQRSEEYA